MGYNVINPFCNSYNPKQSECHYLFLGFSRVMIRPVGRVSRFLDSRGSSRVESGGLTGRFESGQDIDESSRFGSGRVGSPWPDPPRSGRSGLTREEPGFFFCNISIFHTLAKGLVVSKALSVYSR